MKASLIISVLLICFYECYWPIPDRDKEQFEYYCDKVVTDNKIPKEELIYFKVTTKEKLKVYKANRPVLNAGEKKIINKFKTLNESNDKPRITK